MIQAIGFNTLFAAATIAGISGATEAPPVGTAPITACVFSQDGSSLLAAREGEVLVLSARDGTVQRVLKPDLQRVTSITFCGSTDTLAVAGGVPAESGEVVLLNWKSGRILGRESGFVDLATSLSVSPDGKLLAAASADRTVQLFSLQTTGRLTHVARLEGHAGPVLSVLFGRDSATVVSGSADRSIKVWDIVGRRVIRTLSNHTGAVQGLVPRPSSSGAVDTTLDSFASAGDDHTVRVWQPTIGRMVRIIRHHEKPVLCITYAPDGSVLYSAGAEGVVRMIEADSDSILTQWRAADNWIYAVAVSPDGKLIATGDSTGEVKVWQISNNEQPSLEASFSPTQTSPN